MKKNLKILIILGIIIILGFVFSFSYWYFFVMGPKKEVPIEQTVLSFLEENLEFCQIIKKDVSEEKGEFWLICNNRPFYATYSEGKLNYQLNGWGFLKDTEAWDDLKDCEFYNSEKVENNYQLIFYCPADFKASELKAKVYEFDTQKTKISKIEEKNFLEIINKDIKSIYPFLTDCQIKEFNALPDWQPPALFLTYGCQTGNWQILNLAATSLFPPISMAEELSLEERAKNSFQKAFNCEIDNIESSGKSILITSTCQKQNFLVNYDFSNSDFPIVTYQINCQEPCLEFGKYFIFPPLKELKEAEFLKKKIHQTPIASIYKVGDKIIEVGLDIDNKIVLFWLKSEGFYYGEKYQ